MGLSVGENKANQEGKEHSLDGEVHDDDDDCLKLSSYLVNEEDEYGLASVRRTRKEVKVRARRCE